MHVFRKKGEGKTFEDLAKEELSDSQTPFPGVRHHTESNRSASPRRSLTPTPTTPPGSGIRSRKSFGGSEPRSKDKETKDPKAEKEEAKEIVESIRALQERMMKEIQDSKTNDKFGYLKLPDEQQGRHRRGKSVDESVRSGVSLIRKKSEPTNVGSTAGTRRQIATSKSEIISGQDPSSNAPSHNIHDEKQALKRSISPPRISGKSPRSLQSSPRPLPPISPLSSPKDIKTSPKGMKLITSPRGNKKKKEKNGDKEKKKKRKKTMSLKEDVRNTEEPDGLSSTNPADDWEDDIISDDEKEVSPALIARDSLNFHSVTRCSQPKSALGKYLLHSWAQDHLHTKTKI